MILFSLYKRLSHLPEQAMSRQPESAAATLENLLALQLKLSYLSAMTPSALEEYINSQVIRKKERSLYVAVGSLHLKKGLKCGRQCSTNRGIVV